MNNLESRMYKLCKIQKRKRESGQILIVLLLLLLVLLAAGLAITQRSTTDLSISTQTEQSSRAFSAAEAGIDQAITSSSTSFTVGEDVLQNLSHATVKKVGNLPLPGMAIEYPVKDLAERGLDTFDKENFAQFWLANPDDLSDGPCAPATPSCGYPNDTPFQVYYGDTSVDPHNDPNFPAVEIKVVTRDGTGTYNAFSYYYDSATNATRGGDNGFTDVTGAGNGCVGYSFPTTLSFYTTDNRQFECQVTINPGGAAPLPNWSGQKPILVRVRMLYHSGHPLAVRPSGSNSFPAQGEIVTSTGFSGQSQKRIQLFSEKFVFPPFFDFAIFSAGDISK